MVACGQAAAPLNPSLAAQGAPPHRGFRPRGHSAGWLAVGRQGRPVPAFWPLESRPAGAGLWVRQGFLDVHPDVHSPLLLT